jgi:peptidyl-prolyl cis-trans isomerase SurA
MRARCIALAVAGALLLGGTAAAQSGWTAVDSVVAVVNQDVVLQSEVDRRLAGAEAALAEIKDVAQRTRRRVEIRRQVLASLIDERIFGQAAVALGLTATSQEVDRAIAEVKAQNKIDDAGLAKALETNGFTMTEYRAEIQRQILQAKVSNLILRQRVRVTDDEMRAAYKEAQQRDPKRIGSFEEVRQPLFERMFEEAMMREQGRWLAERRAEAYIDVRIES